MAALNNELSNEDSQITDTMFCTVGMLLYVEVLDSALGTSMIIRSNQIYSRVFPVYAHKPPACTWLLSSNFWS